MKTPDEIKRGLQYCNSFVRVLKGCAYGCTYWDEKYGCGSDYLMTDALAYIRQLEREKEAMIAAVEGDCHHCKHDFSVHADCPCMNCIDGRYWEWCGVDGGEVSL